MNDDKVGDSPRDMTKFRLLQLYRQTYWKA